MDKKLVKLEDIDEVWNSIDPNESDAEFLKKMRFICIAPCHQAVHRHFGFTSQRNRVMTKVTSTSHHLLIVQLHAS